MSSVLRSPERFSPLNDKEDTFGFAFLKTGYNTILPEFTADLAESGVRPIHISPLRLSPDAVDYIYRDSTNEHFYSNMRKHLTNCAVLAMILHAEDSAMPTQAIVNSLKSGSNGYPNLRERYQKREDVVCDEDFESWCREGHERQDELTITLTQRNVFHAADDQAEADATFVIINDTTPRFYNPNGTTDPRKLAQLVEQFDSVRYD